MEGSWKVLVVWWAYVCLFEAILAVLVGFLDFHLLGFFGRFNVGAKSLCITCW